MKLAVRDRIVDDVDDDDDLDGTDELDSADELNRGNDYDVAESPGVTEAIADPDKSKRD
jgi:hypothetical protein